MVVVVKVAKKVAKVKESSRGIGGQGIGKWSGGRAAGGGGLARATANRSDTHLTHSPAKPKSPHSMETFSSGEDFLYCILHNVC